MYMYYIQAMFLETERKSAKYLKPSRSITEAPQYVEIRIEKVQHETETEMKASRRYIAIVTIQP